MLWLINTAVGIHLSSPAGRHSTLTGHSGIGSDWRFTQKVINEVLTPRESFFIYYMPPPLPFFFLTANREMRLSATWLYDHDKKTHLWVPIFQYRCENQLWQSIICIFVPRVDANTSCVPIALFPEIKRAANDWVARLPLQCKLLSRFGI